MWVVVTFFTTKAPHPTHIKFFEKMRIAGPGWKKVAELSKVEAIKGEILNSTLCWIGCTVMILGLLMSTGKFLFLQWVSGGIYLAVAIAGGLLLRSQMKKMTFLG